jgi:hypothetical protein
LPGYSGNGTSCSSIDSCLANNGGCDAHALCTPTGPGTNSCVCNHGYSGNGLSCNLLVGVLTPLAATASSAQQGLDAVNALLYDTLSWTSNLLTGKSEWLRYDFGVAVKLTNVKLIGAHGLLGSSARIQGSNDGIHWDDVHTMSFGNLSLGLPWLLYDTADETIDTNASYRYVRYISAPTLYVQIAYLEFSGSTGN